MLGYISAIKNALGKTTTKEFLPLQAGNMFDTCASVDDLVERINYKLTTTIKGVIRVFLGWYLEFYNQ